MKTLTEIDQQIQEVLASNGAHTLLKDILRKGITVDCVDAYHDVQFAAGLLKERMNAILLAS
jgi:hypothetical protein